MKAGGTVGATVKARLTFGSRSDQHSPLAVLPDGSHERIFLPAGSCWGARHPDAGRRLGRPDAQYPRDESDATAAVSSRSALQEAPGGGQDAWHAVMRRARRGPGSAGGLAAPAGRAVQVPPAERITFQQYPGHGRNSRRPPAPEGETMAAQSAAAAAACCCTFLLRLAASMTVLHQECVAAAQCGRPGWPRQCVRLGQPAMAPSALARGGRGHGGASGLAGGLTGSCVGNIPATRGNGTGHPLPPACPLPLTACRSSTRVAAALTHQ